MTLMEWISLAQTIVLGLTGLLIYWYTRETQKLRQETATQSKIMQRQLNVLLQDQEHRKNSLEMAARPILSIRGVTYGATQTRIKIANIGGIIHDVSVEFEEGIQGSISPTLGNDTESNLSLNSQAGIIKGESEMYFTLQYTNSLDQRIRATYEMIILRNFIVQKSAEILK